MRLPSSTIRTFLAISCLSLAACGSVSNRAVSGSGGTPGSDGGAAGGTTGAGGTAAGGTTGTTGGAGGSSVDAGPSDAGPSDGPRTVVRGAITSFGVLAPAGGAIRIARQRFGPTLLCGGNVCVSGGLIPQ